MKNMSREGDHTLFRDKESLSSQITIREGEKEWFAQKDGQDHLSFKLNSYYLNLAKNSEAIRKQSIPSVEELTYLSYESDDPLHEEPYSPLERMVHRYTNRVAILVCDHCVMHCRHCFRRSFTGQGNGVISQLEMDVMASYIAEHPEIREILLTGGDILSLSDRSIEKILKNFSSIRPNLVIRIATRVPVVEPSRMTENLISILAACKPLWLVMQYNHVDELSDESRAVLQRCSHAGIPMANQSVLLRGINDSSDTLADLFQELLIEGVKPYYLFQGDLAQGTSHFRVSLERGWEIMRELRLKVSGLAMPHYAVDLPGGGGKVPLDPSYFLYEKEGQHIFKNPEGEIFSYPKECSNE